LCKLLSDIPITADKKTVYDVPFFLSLENGSQNQKVLLQSAVNDKCEVGSGKQDSLKSGNQILHSGG
jgi:hypothetical protein